MDIRRSAPKRARGNSQDGGSSFDIGRRIRDARKQKGLTLEQVAEATQLSVGFLSQVERNITRPSLASLTTITRALETTVSAVLQQSDLPIAVSRREGRVAHQIKNEAGSYEKLTTALSTQLLNAVKLHMPSGLYSKVYAYEGEVVIYVLGGSIRYIIEGVIYELNPGDALHFSTSKPHRVSTPADSSAEIIVISTQPILDNNHGLSQNIQIKDTDGD